MTQFSAVQQLIFPSHLDALRCTIISRRTFCHSLTYWCFLKPLHLSFLFLYSISGSIWSNTITLPIHLQKSPLSLIHSLTNGLSNCEICQIILEILRQPLTFTKYFLICILVLIFRLFHGPAVDFIWRMQWWCANKIDEHIKFVEVEKILDTVESAEVAQVLENARINGFEQFFLALLQWYCTTQRLELYSFRKKCWNRWKILSENINKRMSRLSQPKASSHRMPATGCCPVQSWHWDKGEQEPEGAKLTKQVWNS